MPSTIDSEPLYVCRLPALIYGAAMCQGRSKTRPLERTPEQQSSWRDGIYDQIGELMSMQGKLSIERMCRLACVSRAGFYRSLQERDPVAECAFGKPA
jgi:hypothetical protein